LQDTRDASSILAKCLVPLATERLTATTVAMYLTSPFAIHCNEFVSAEEKDTAGDKFQQLLSERGRRHESQTIQNKYPGMIPIPFTTDEADSSYQ